MASTLSALPRRPHSAPDPAATVVPGAAGARVRDRLAAPATGTVLHAGEHAIYAGVGDHVVGVVSRRGSLVTAAIGTTLPRLPPVPVGSPVALSDGLLRLAGLVVTVTRVLPTRAPEISDPARAARLLDLACSEPTGDTLRDLAARGQLPERGLALLAAGRPGAVGLLLGRGDGLTPVGDDVLVGWLAVAATARDRSSVATAVARGASRTTPLSAALLADAVGGDVMPELRDLLLALGSGREVGPAVEALRAVGHTSGAGMLLGARLALPGPLVAGGPR